MIKFIIVGSVIMLYLSIVMGLYIKTTHYSRFVGKRQIVFISPFISMILLFELLFDKKIELKLKFFTISNFDLFLFFTTYMMTNSVKVKVKSKKKNSIYIIKSLRCTIIRKDELFSNVIERMELGKELEAAY